MVCGFHFQNPILIFSFSFHSLTPSPNIYSSNLNGTMLRCPPTTIVLGKRDLVEYEKRQKSRREIEAEGISQQFARIAVGGLDGPLFGYGW